jgi:UV DNA damage repair endonuclease
VRALVWENLLGLRTILCWNAEHGVLLFRMGQSLVPFASHQADVMVEAKGKERALAPPGVEIG